MNKKILSISIFLAVILILLGFTPAIALNSIDNQKIVVVETSINYGKSIKKIETELGTQEAEELKEILTNLNNAIKQDDKKSISYYESLLNEKGILGKEHKNIFSKKNIEKFYSRIQNLPLLKKLNSKIESLSKTDISNTFCITNIAGSGFMLYTIGLLLTVPTLMLVNIFGEAILTVLLPIYVLILLITHLIPFRILLPAAVINVEEGSISTIGGSAGSQSIDVESSTQVNLMGLQELQ